MNQNKINELKLEISNTIEYISREYGDPSSEKLTRAMTALTRCYQFLLKQDLEEDEGRLY